MKRIESGLAVNLIANIIKHEDGDEVYKEICVLDEVKSFEDKVYEQFLDTVNRAGKKLGNVELVYKFQVLENTEWESALEIIFNWEDHYYKLIFHVDSYYGVHYSTVELYEVEPKVKQITIYE